MRILLVEDDMPLALGLQQSLRHEGFVVNHVDNGNAAISALAVSDQDLVILDLGLPDIDGLEILKRTRDRKLGIPVIILTARDSLEDKIRGLDFGADDYLVKPFEISELLARLRVIERRLGTAKSALIICSQVALDTTAHKIFIGEDEFKASKKEYMVL
jgi:two-component system OmpR family response regulator